ncbi:FtsX-like permease family protein [Spiroplasma endosymbiont of Polydrusus pterygomalis]|uniref:ABC transporter permease n=1 Tax=Spiroplasma endosymbiont of Polydrusus pterygomalis TaxID=3139327 RepID=UPI003CCAA184
MGNLFVNVLRGIKKRLLQYLGIIILLVIVISTLSALYSTASRAESGFYTVVNNSGKYDYRINLKELNNYKDIATATSKIKRVIKNQFKDHPQRSEIEKQIDEIKENDLRNNSFPKLSSGITIHEDLQNYLLNWGLSYQAILFNDILKNKVKNNKINNFQHYEFSKSFFKTFDYENVTSTKKIYYSLENAFYTSVKSESFNFSPARNNINEVYIAKGTKPAKSCEVVINPEFACINNIKLNDNITVIDKKVPLKVVGFGYAYWGITGSRTATNPNPTAENTSPVYMTNEYFNSLINDSTFRINLNNIFLLKVKNNDGYFISKLEELLIKTFSFNFGSIITTDSEDIRSGQILESFKMENILFTAITLVVLLVIIFIIMSYVRKEIDLQRPQVGLLKALGYTNFQVAISFVVLIFFITFISSIIGLGIGLGLQIWFNALNNIGFFMPLPTLFFSWIVFIVSLIVIPIIFIIISYTQSDARLRVNPLLLIYDRPSNSSSKLISILKYPFRHWPFKQRLAVAFTLKSVGKLFLVFFTFIFVSFLLVFQSSATDLFDDKIKNLYGYYNKEVTWNTSTSSMYTYANDSKLKIDKQVFDWASQKDIAEDKLAGTNKYHEWKADDFHIDSLAKLNKIQGAINNNNFKDYFMSSEEINILYQNTKTESDCEKFIDPKEMLPDKSWVKIICQNIHQVFNYISTNTGINPEINSFPGVSLGLNIYNNNNYPTIEISLRLPNQWKGHNQGRMLAKNIKVTGFYNDADQNLVWKNWFNFKEANNRDIDPIFNNSHILQKENVTYIDNRGQSITTTAYILPAVISKTLSILNDYKIDDRFLMLANWYNYTIPVIYEVKGIIKNNLDTSNVYTNLDDLRTSIELINGNQPISDSFNYWLSKDTNIFPANYINISQPSAEYTSDQILAKNLEPINKIPFINDLVKRLLIEIFDGIKTIINITKVLTLFAVAFVLVIIVNMILDNNLLIIAMMKSLGYRVNEINRLIIGSYVVALLTAFILGTVISYAVWNIITLIIATKAGIVFNVAVSAVTILSSFAMVFLIMVIGYGVGLYLIKFKPITSLLQGS